MCQYNFELFILYVIIPPAAYASALGDYISYIIVQFDYITFWFYIWKLYNRLGLLYTEYIIYRLYTEYISYTQVTKTLYNRTEHLYKIVFYSDSPCNNINNFF